ERMVTSDVEDGTESGTESELEWFRFALSEDLVEFLYEYKNENGVDSCLGCYAEFRGNVGGYSVTEID
ncbi:MAG: hypothetical protein Q4C70_14975, partial [Planctomycetia bacterium]|nr:hypothetical protein [Planctomycetia bacterium]